MLEDMQRPPKVSVAEWLLVAALALCCAPAFGQTVNYALKPGQTNRDISDADLNRPTVGGLTIRDQPPPRNLRLLRDRPEPRPSKPLRVQVGQADRTDRARRAQPKMVRRTVARRGAASMVAGDADRSR
jgi:hypothetical protein